MLCVSIPLILLKMVWYSSWGFLRSGSSVGYWGGWRGHLREIPRVVLWVPKEVLVFLLEALHIKEVCWLFSRKVNKSPVSSKMNVSYKQQNIYSLPKDIPLFVCICVCVRALTILLAPSRCPLCHRSHAPRGWAHHPPGSPSCCPWSQRARTGRSCAPCCPVGRRWGTELIKSLPVTPVTIKWLFVQHQIYYLNFL